MSVDNWSQIVEADTDLDAWLEKNPSAKKNPQYAAIRRAYNATFNAAKNTRGGPTTDQKTAIINAANAIKNLS